MQAFETLKDEEPRENRGTCPAVRKTAVDQVESVLEQGKTWEERVRLAEQQISIQEHNVKIFTTLLLGRAG